MNEIVTKTKGSMLKSYAAMLAIVSLIVLSFGSICSADVTSVYSTATTDFTSAAGAYGGVLAGIAPVWLGIILGLVVLFLVAGFLKRSKH